MLSTANYVERGMPLLLIDSRSINYESPCNSLKDAEKRLIEIEEEVRMGQKYNERHSEATTPVRNSQRAFAH